jgi:RNA polymerase sigma-70 factor (ECF subfamily)
MEPPELSTVPTEEPTEMDVEPEPTASPHAWDGAWPQTEDELRTLVDAWLDRLVRYAFRRLGSIQDAEDAVQEVFLRAFAQRSELAKASPVAAYLYRSVANACTDLLRKRSRVATSRDGPQADELLSPESGPPELAAAADELRRAEDLLGRLPDAQAEVIRLRVFDGLRLGEIAAAVGCSVNTVASRLRYGFRKLRQLVSTKQGYQR